MSPMSALTTNQTVATIFHARALTFGVEPYFRFCCEYFSTKQYLKHNLQRCLRSKILMRFGPQLPVSGQFFPPAPQTLQNKYRYVLVLKSASPSCRTHCIDWEAHLVQDTGSDMVAEDNLATLFGRGEIETPVDKAFRTVLRRHSTQVPLSKDIYLWCGRGPTLERALAENGSFMFATVVQCAFLCSVGLHSPCEIWEFWHFAGHH